MQNAILKSLGYKPTQSGGRYAVGIDNGRGGVSIAHFTKAQGGNLVNRLMESGVKCALRLTGRPYHVAVILG